MNKLVYLRSSILESIKILKHQFWYNHLKPKYGEKAKLCYTYTASFIAHKKADNIYKYIAEDVETIFDT